MTSTANPESSDILAPSERAVEELVAETEQRGGEDMDPREAFRLSLEGLPSTARGPAWADGRDVIGEAYQRVVSAATRRNAGQFFTPLWVGRAMANWLLAEPTSIVLDPGCGSGSLLIASAQERQDEHVRLVGLDADPLAVKMAEMTQKIRRIKSMSVRTGDFLREPLPERPDAVICNPPFTRHHDVPVAVKAAIHEGSRSASASASVDFPRSTYSF